jgi:hypothetical protein
VEDEDTGSGKSLTVHKVLLKPEKEVEDTAAEMQTVQNDLQDQGLEMQGHSGQRKH